MRDAAPLDIELTTLNKTFNFAKDTVATILIMFVIGVTFYTGIIGGKETYNYLIEKLGGNGLFSIATLIAMAGIVTNGARKSNRVSIDVVGSVVFLILFFIIGNIVIHLSS